MYVGLPGLPGYIRLCGACMYVRLRCLDPSTLPGSKDAAAPHERNFLPSLGFPLALTCLRAIRGARFHTAFASAL